MNNWTEQVLVCSTYKILVIKYFLKDVLRVLKVW